MTKVTVTSLIAAPVDRVFALFTDLDHVAERVEGIKRIEMLTAGGFGLGTRWRELRHIMGRDVSEDMVVTAFEKGRGYTVTNDTHAVRLDSIFTFEPKDNGTQVSIEFTLDTQSFQAKLMSPLGWVMTGKIRQALTQDLEDLKRVAEKAE